MQIYTFFKKTHFHLCIQRRNCRRLARLLTHTESFTLSIDPVLKSLQSYSTNNAETHNAPTYLRDNSLFRYLLTDSFHLTDFLSQISIDSHCKTCEVLLFPRLRRTVLSVYREGGNKNEINKGTMMTRK